MKKPASIFTLLFLLVGLMACSEAPSSTDNASKEEITSPVKTAPEATPVVETTISEPDQVTISEESTPSSAPADQIVTTPKKEVPINQAPKQVLTVNEPVKVEVEKPIEKEKVKKELKEKLPAKTEKKAEEVVKEKVQLPVAEKKEEIHSVKKALTHDQWDQLLRKHVSAAGKVNYKGFKADLSKLDAYLKSLQDNPIKDSWSRNQKMAYWINAYNAFTVKLIVDNYPTSSITKLHGGKPWDVSWIKIGGKSYSLNNIENDILRPQYKDARIHFAVNCAARSCPPILNRAWTSETLNRYFDKQAKAFINNSKYNKVSENQVEISKIFEWYAADFGDIVEYLNKYSSVTIKPGAKVTYMEYDWALNE